MAKIHEEVVIVKVSKLVKTDAETDALVSDELMESLEQVVQELLGDSVIVEVESA